MAVAIAKTFDVDVEGIGTFTIRRRTIADQLNIEARADHILGGPTSSAGLNNIAYDIAMLGRMTVKAPDGWDVDELDPLDQDDVDKVRRVAGEVRAAEDRFRGRPAPARKDVGPGA